MIAKLFEVRDSMTCIPCIAVKLEPADSREAWLLYRAGFGQPPEQKQYVLFASLLSDYTSPFTYDPYVFPDRTMREAHKYVIEHFDDLNNGEVIDVQYILGETHTPKQTSQPPHERKDDDGD